MQQQLLEPPPTRRIIVPRGHVAHYGFDVSTQRISAAYAYGAPDVTREARTASFADLSGSARLAHIWAETDRFVTDLLNTWPMPGFVLVEQPSGARPNPNLVYACGVIIGAVHATLEREYGHAIAVETIPSATWKLRATGFGRHDKPTKKKLGRAPEFEDYGVARWARANGYAGHSYDEADALGIAEAARRTVALDPR